MKRQIYKYDSELGYLAIIAVACYCIGLLFINGIITFQKQNNTLPDIWFMLILTFFIIVFAFVLVFTICMIVLHINNHTKNIDEIITPEIEDCRTERIKNILLKDEEELLKLYNIVNIDYLEDKEKNFDISVAHRNEHIWLITNSLELEMYDKTYKEIIKNNISNGTKYTYFLPYDEKMIAEADALDEIYDNAIEKIYLNENSKFLFDKFDIIIYYPIHPKNKREAFICMDFKSIPVKYRIISKEDTDVLVGVLNSIKKEFLKGGKNNA